MQWSCSQLVDTFGVMKADFKHFVYQMAIAMGSKWNRSSIYQMVNCFPPLLFYSFLRPFSIGVSNNWDLNKKVIQRKCGLRHPTYCHILNSNASFPGIGRKITRSSASKRISSKDTMSNFVHSKIPFLFKIQIAAHSYCLSSHLCHIILGHVGPIIQ